MTERRLLSARGLSLSFGVIPALVDVDVDLWPGEMLAIVGESGSGKTTLLNVLSGRQRPDAGVVTYRDPDGAEHDVHAMAAPMLRTLHRSDWGFVHQDPRQNLRMGVSAGGNVGERLMAQGARHYGDIRAQALDWLVRVEQPGSPRGDASAPSTRRPLADSLRLPNWRVFSAQPARGGRRRPVLALPQEALTPAYLLPLVRPFVDEPVSPLGAFAGFAGPCAGLGPASAMRRSAPRPCFVFAIL